MGLQTEWQQAYVRVLCHSVLPAADTGSLGRRHAFIYSSTFWELAVKDKVNTSLYTWVHTNT